MIIYLAGQGTKIKLLPNKELYEHVIFSKFAFLPERFKMMRKLLRKEKKNESKQRKISKDS